MKKRIVLIIFMILLFLGMGSGIYLGSYYHATDPITGENLIKTKDFIAYTAEDPHSGIIFYPGAKVEYLAYAPFLKALSEENITSVGLNLTGNIAFLDMNAADGIKEQFPEIDTWYLAGHSLGGVAAAIYAEKHEGEFDGLIFLASYSTKDLTEDGFRILTIYGDRDQVLNLEKYEEAKEKLPKDYQEFIIEGGNHGYFGNYGEQKGDGVAAITRETQQKIAVDEIRKFLYDEEE